jgi:hypothetical protein
MKKLSFLAVAALLLTGGRAFAAVDADSPSIACNVNRGQYVRVSFVVEFLPDHPEPGNDTIVDAKFSSGMSGKDVVVSFKDAQHLSAMVTLDGYCEPSGWMNTHWAYDSHANGASYTITYQNPISIVNIK